MRKLPRWIDRAASLVGAIVAVGLAAPLDAAELEPIAGFGDNPGALAMHVYRPEGLAAGAPLVVAMHGCRQTAADFDDETGLVALADDLGLVLVFPEQNLGNNERNCFNWFDEDDNRPGVGESASILAMVDWALAEYDADPERVFALGLSAGGAMTSVLLADYPERFAGGAVFAGTPFDCNRPYGFASGWWLWWNMLSGDAGSAVYACGLFGFLATDRTAQEWGDAVRDVAAEPQERRPLVSLWHGAADETVDPSNLDELIEQWTNVAGVDSSPDLTEEVAGATHTVFRDGDGVARVEAWLIPGFPHAAPVDPDAASVPCGAQAEFIRDADLCAVRRVAAFWGLTP